MANRESKHEESFNMLEVFFQDWRKSRTKEEKKRFHEKRVFEIIFSEAISEYGLVIEDISMIRIYCHANEKFDFSYKKIDGLEIKIDSPYDLRDFMSLESQEEKFEEFKKLVFLYVVPVLKEITGLSEERVFELTNLALDQIPHQNYEIVFLAGKTPKKSPNRKKVAILRGIHQSAGFRLYCEVFNSRGRRIANKLLVEEVGNEVVYARFLGDLKWESDSNIVVKSRTSSWQETVEC